jgi:hypothetical protein
MKTLLNIIRISFLLIIIQFFTINAMAKTEEQKYRVVHTDDELEIRFYPSATLATVYYEAKSYKKLAYPGFRKLAGYIFGDNESDTKISMTSPVHMGFNSSGSSMSFVMPSSYNMENLPQPDDSDVILEKTEDIYVAAIQFKGYASDEKISEYSEKLKNLLNEKGIKYYDDFRYLGYDPPFKPFGRRNEIIVPIEWSE